MRRILITGASRGLGRAMTDYLQRAGHSVAGCATSAVDALNDQYQTQSFSVVDVADFQQVTAWRDHLRQHWGVPELIINNAGVINASRPLWEVPAEELSRVMGVNVLGVCHILQAFLPDLIAGAGGVCVNFSSGWGRSVSPHVAPYCASKWAVEGLSRSVAAEVPGHVGVVAVNPGIIHTEMLESCFSGDAASFPQPEAWAQRAVPFLLALTAEDNSKSLDVP